MCIRDRGVGIEGEDLDRIFERFYRVDQARSRNTGGSGLGLSIVKHVAADHGGEVTMWSEPGRGSTFTLRIPAADVPAGQAHVAPSGTVHDAARDEGTAGAVPVPVQHDVRRAVETPAPDDVQNKEVGA